MCRHAFRLTTCLVTCCSLVGCSTDTTEPPQAVVTITGAGATFPAPLYLKWIEEYERLFPHCNITYDVVGSGEGTDRFLAGSVEFGASDAALTPEQIGQVQRGALLVPMTAGSIAIAYHPGLPAGLQLDRQTLADIFLGTVKRWNAPQIVDRNPDKVLPDEPIRVVVRDDSSGTTYAFTNHLAATSEAWRNGHGVSKSIYDPPGALRAQGNAGVASRIQGTPYSLGYVEFGTAKRLQLAMAALENRQGIFVPPSGHSGLATLINAEFDQDLRLFLPDPEGAQSYPIVTYSWLLLYQQYHDAQQAKAVRDFANWCLDDGQQYSESLGYIRLAPTVVATAHQAVSRIGH